jgi:uncharacterized protein
VAELHWDAANRAHVERHGLRPEECEQALDDPNSVAWPADQDQGEQRLGIIGETDAGRLLLVVLAVRDEEVRVVTAYPANRRQVRAYRRVNP